MPKLITVLASIYHSASTHSTSLNAKLAARQNIIRLAPRARMRGIGRAIESDDRFFESRSDMCGSRVSTDMHRAPIEDGSKLLDVRFAA
jgi:hypothetical protein